MRKNLKNDESFFYLSDSCYLRVHSLYTINFRSWLCMPRGAFKYFEKINIMFSKQQSTTGRRAFTGLLLSASFLMAGMAAGTATAGEIVPANMEVYKQAASAKKPIIMHVHATWCPVCAKQNLIIESLIKEPEFKDVIVFKIDFDADKGLVEQLGVKNQSTLIAAKGPLEVERTAGITDKEQIRQFIRKSL